MNLIQVAGCLIMIKAHLKSTGDAEKYTDEQLVLMILGAGDP